MIKDMLILLTNTTLIDLSINKLRKYIIIIIFIITNITVMYFSESDRKMLFPDHYFFAERRLVNHMIEEKRVKNLDDCELLCYLNDDCVSLNFKKDPDDNEPVHICELNNATHLKYASDLTTDINLYHRGSKVSYKSIFRNCRRGIIILRAVINVYANFRAFDHSVSSFFFHSNP